MEVLRSRVTDREGTEAFISTEILDPKRVLVELKSGRRLLVPRSALQWNEASGYSVNFSFDGLEEAPSADGKAYVIPVIHERPTVTSHQSEHKVVHLEKRVDERHEVVEAMATINEVEIERVQKNQFVDEPPQVRHEGDTVIFPLVEEVLVVEKRLLLREEVHVTQVSREEPRSHTVTLRSEYVAARRSPGQAEGATWPLSAEDFVLLNEGQADLQESSQVPEIGVQQERLEEVVPRSHLL
jgi:stress response protein YsnF